MIHNAGFSVKSLSFAFKKGNPLFFDSLSFLCRSGVVTFLQGKNGVGKSTLFRLIGGHADHHELLEGAYQLDGETFVCSHNQFPRAYCQHVKMVIQDVDQMLALECTVEQNVRLAQVLRYPTLSLLPPVRKMDNMLHGIDMQLKASQLSGGQRQLLVLSMMLQKPVRLLLLDEPTASLDDYNADLVIEMTENMARQYNLVVLIITHDADLVSKHKNTDLLVLKQTGHGKQIEKIRS